MSKLVSSVLCKKTLIDIASGARHYIFSVKQQQKWGSSAAHIIDQKEIGFFPDKVSTGKKEVTRPYITLIVELGANDPPKDKSFMMTWKVISSVERDRYKCILATDDFLADHPRQDEASLNLIRQMLPFYGMMQ
ncbi:hypothetical protein EDC04DRAFT_3095049 [Pisolithus marmoratus]|nr:hypothetical protein EDC04DRAFT_3095049 [Pisolithus marmoratus]